MYVDESPAPPSLRSMLSTIGTWASGPLAFIAVWFAMGGLPPMQRAVGAVFALTVAWWMTEALPLPITSMLAMTLLVIVADIPQRDAFGAFGDPIIVLFIGSFVMAKAMEVSRLGERLAWLILSRPFASATPGRLMLTLGAVGALVSSVLSNTATVAMLLPIGLGILGALGTVKRGDPYSMAMLLMLTWGASVAVGVPIGTPPNMLALSLLETSAGVRLSFSQWLMFGFPVTIIMLTGIWLILSKLYGVKRSDAHVDIAVARKHLDELGPLRRAERNTLIAFTTSVLLWFGPDISRLIWGAGSTQAIWADEHLTLAIGGITGALLLFLLPAPRRQRMNWERAAQIDWGTILLFAGGISLGRAMDASGLPETIGVAVTAMIGPGAVWTLTALVIAAAILLSEIGSNTASASILIPMVIGISEVAGISPVPPVLGTALGASLGFMMPISTPPNAIVYGSGLVPARDMMKAGLLIDILGFFVTFGCLRLILPLMGLV